MLAKVQRGLEMVRAMGKLPFTNGSLTDAARALAILEEVWPDSGKSCYLETPVRREKKVDLSVIVPSYNNETYVLNCVRSVLDQKTEASFQVIVVNDGSTDGSRELLDQTYGEDSRVRIVHQENKGLSGARNTGIDLAEGRYLMFVDSDDRLLPGAIDALMSVALREKANMVCGGYTCLFPDGKEIVGQTFGAGKVWPLGTLPGYAWGKVYHSDLFGHLRFPEGYWFEDSISALILWPLCGENCYTVEGCVYEYLMNPQGISAQAARKPKALDSLWLYHRLLEERRSFGLSQQQADYEHFLEMVRLTYSRTRGFSNDVKKSVFVLQMKLKQDHFGDFASGGSAMNKKMEQALCEGNYKKYAFLGELPL